MIHELLGVGKENRKDMNLLKNETGLTARAIRAAIRDERRAGHFILTERDLGGFWLWDGDAMDELETFARENQRAALDLLKTIGPFLREIHRRREREAEES